MFDAISVQATIDVFVCKACEVVFSLAGMQFKYNEDYKACLEHVTEQQDVIELVELVSS